jgi:hypothetical protein
MYSEKYSASAQMVLVVGPAYSHISWPVRSTGSEEAIMPRRFWPGQGESWEDYDARKPFLLGAFS